MNYLANSSVAFVLRRYLRSLMFFLRRHYIHQWAVERVYRVLKTMNQSRVATKKNPISTFILAWERDIYVYICTHIHIYIFFSLCIFRTLHPGSSPVRLCGRHVVFLSFFWLNTLFLSLSLFASREIETYHSTQIQVYTLTDMHTLYIVHWVYALPPLPSLLNGAAQLFHWYNTIIHSQKLLTQPQLVSYQNLRA